METIKELKIWTTVCITVLSCVMILSLKDIYIASLQNIDPLPQICECPNLGVNKDTLQ